MERTYKKPNLNAPRKRSTAKDFLAYPDKDPHGFFAKMKLQYPQLEKYSNKEIAGWIHEHNKLMAEEVVNNRKGATLPQSLGVVMIGMCKLTEKTANRNIDYNTSKKLGIEVTHRNSHTDGYVAKVYYINNMPKCKFKNYYQWRFKPCRNLSKAVAARVKNEGIGRYYIFPPTVKVEGLFRKWKAKKQSWRVRKEEQEYKMILENYIEFDL